MISDTSKKVGMNFTQIVMKTPTNVTNVAYNFTCTNR